MELIVVLVILAILAAILVPALLGYIDKARNKQYVLQARNVLMAAQVIADEAYAQGVEPGFDLEDVIRSANDQHYREKDQISRMADVDAWIWDFTMKEEDEIKLDKDNHDAYTIVGIEIYLYPDEPFYIFAVLEDGVWNITRCGY